MRILISLNEPSNTTAYEALQTNYKADIVFRPFYQIEALSSREFRDQKINLPEYTAIVFSSRPAIDAYFYLAEELRFKVPETMKYFCTTQIVANYLQKHIVYRKRKIFFGNGTPDSVVALIGPKHRNEKFLITKNEGSNATAITSLFKKAKLDYTEGVLVKSVTQDLHDLDINSFDIVVLYNRADVKSLYENFPDFKQGDVKFVSFGKGVVKPMEEAGLEIAAMAPTPDAPNAARAIELYLSKN
ncbi:MAG TPA: uroporphyrinogen-III synthase [Candidatus Cryptobacteroides sp.]|jgi:uroporphyrinogen-III synthase|nr:uroporphyrinogen-III synthase [Rikenellaceae bacterium]HOE94287.1 uroporphyrinogen-III synthase [Candidatus Cryptobacteroides sp.]